MSESRIASLLREFGSAEKMLSSLTPEEVTRLPYDWKLWARPEQLAPPGDWRTWIVQSGRGWGKTRTAAEWVRDKVESGAAGRIALVGETAGDVREVMIEGRSGIMKISPPWFEPKYEPSKRRLTWPNGAVASTYSADEPDQLRGPEHDCGWLDEWAKWARAQDTMDNFVMGLRIAGVSPPQAVITTTPRPTIAMKKLLASPHVVVTRGSTYDNRSNLDVGFFAEIESRYKGTRIGRQELFGEILADVEGALWSHVLIDQLRIFKIPDGINIEHLVVGVDPATTSNPKSNETGIIVAGRSGRSYFIFGDFSLRAPPDAWGRAVLRAYDGPSLDERADEVVIEKNAGHDLLLSLIRSIEKEEGRPPVRIVMVNASKGKVARAEPIHALYEQRRVHHVGTFPELEDQLTSWVPGDESPDRMDACFIAGTIVATECGDMPIEDVRVGERVHTRHGLRRVTASGCTGSARRVLRLAMSDGRSLVGTPDHPVMVTGRGFVALDALVWGDRLVTWPSVENPSSSTASPSPAIQTQQAAPTVSTSPRTSTTAEPSAWDCFTARSGSPSMGRFLAAMTSIIATKIRSTTRSKTLSASRRKSTLSDTGISLLRRAVSTWNAFARWLRHGIGRLPLASISNGSVLWHGLASALTLEPASTAGLRSWPASPPHDSAHANASRRDESRTPPTRTARSADAFFRHRSTARTTQHDGSAGVHVLDVRDGGSAPVYNLTVDDCPEYFANGVLVHNCVWALTALSQRAELRQKSTVKLYEMRDARTSDDDEPTAEVPTPRASDPLASAMAAARAVLGQPEPTGDPLLEQLKRQYRAVMGRDAEED